MKFFAENKLILNFARNSVGYLFNSGYKISVIEPQRVELRGVNSNKISTRGRNKKAKEKFNEQENAPLQLFHLFIYIGMPITLLREKFTFLI